jgi:enoyl-[acyl-carrier protein] reductase III
LLKNKTILVTGGTRGIGRSITKKLIDNGARVIANYARNQKSADTLIRGSSGDQLTLVRADITREKGILNLLDKVNNIALDGFIHCAATGVHAPIKDLKMKHWDWTMNLNVRAFFELVTSLQNQFNTGSSIIALSSEGAVKAVPNYSLVGASKGALESLCRHLALEFSPQQIRCNILSPGSVLTEAWDAFPDKEERMKKVKNRIPGGEMTLPEEVASVALFLSSDSSKAINGQTIVVDHGERIVF